MLIPLSKDWKEAETRKRTREFGRKRRSPYICIGPCGTYVGANHCLHPRQEGCILGSDLEGER